jgi:hypothetical protein
MTNKFKELWCQGWNEAEDLGLDSIDAERFARDYVDGYIDHQIEIAKYRNLDAYPKPVKVSG